MKPIIITNSIRRWNVLATGRVVLQQTTSGWTFDWPVDVAVKYVTTLFTKSLTTHGQVCLSMAVTGSDPVLVPTEGTDPVGRLRLIVIGTGNNRWWSNPLNINLTELIKGLPFSPKMTMNLNVPLFPDQWSDWQGITGMTNLDLFWGAFSNPESIGFTLGAQFHGHGLILQSGRLSFEYTGMIIIS